VYDDDVGVTGESSTLEHGAPADPVLPRLTGELLVAYLGTTALVGRAPDLSWSEDCVAVRGASLEQVCAWGRDFDQHAVFLLTEGTHAVVSCWSRAELGRRQRLLGGEDPGVSA